MEVAHCSGLWELSAILEAVGDEKCVLSGSMFLDSFEKMPNRLSFFGDSWNVDNSSY